MLELECFEDREPIHLWHLDVEEDHVEFLFLDHHDGLFAITALAYDLDVGILLQHSANELAGERLVVRDQSSDLRLSHSSARTGSCMTTVTPPSGRLLTSKQCWLL